MNAEAIDFDSATNDFNSDGIDSDCGTDFDSEEIDFDSGIIDSDSGIIDSDSRVAGPVIDSSLIPGDSF